MPLQPVPGGNRSPDPGYNSSQLDDDRSKKPELTQLKDHKNELEIRPSRIPRFREEERNILRITITS